MTINCINFGLSTKTRYSDMVSLADRLSAEIEIGMVAVSFILPYLYPSEEVWKIKPYFLLVYCHVVLWVFLFLGDLYLRYYHHMLYCYGCIKFYQTTKFLRRMVFYIISGGNVVLLVIVTVVQEICFNRLDCTKLLSLKPVQYIWILVCIEGLAAVFFLVQYLVITIRFQRNFKHPDVHQEDNLISYMQFQGISEVGYLDQDSIAELLEKQADLISYLQQYNAHLSQQLLKLKARLDSQNCG
ncbi:transmembrane protein 192-like isoform X3 [Tachypleus tridentatus]|uniref:transmembrane protein 192-like isoform X3 n=1 Tax=Tachypleus tridentatus TaxID=6853 RepID=UPI003FD01382